MKLSLETWNLVFSLGVWLVMSALIMLFNGTPEGAVFTGLTCIVGTIIWFSIQLTVFQSLYLPIKD